jgi:methyl-accepting chemotaxis protein
VFAAALEAHEAWNAKLREAIKTGDCPTPVEQARRDDCCTFGKWLHADESFKAAQPDRWQNLHDLHERFHRHAARVLECALSGRRQEAEQLANAPEFAEIKKKLSQALTLTTA